MSDLDHSKLLLEVIPRTMRMVRSEIRKIAGNEFTIPQYRVLAKISKTPVSNQELAEWMGVTPPTMTKMVDKLVERGLVWRDIARDTRPEAHADRRRISIQATPRGAERVGKIRASVQQIFARRIGQLPAESKRELLAGLTVLKELFS